jgi:hypothetical protein
MEIKTFSPSEQIDPAVDLGVVPPPLPEILNLEQLVAVAVPPPPLIIEGVLHQGCKMILGGTSKSNKSWCLLDMAMSVASGQDWWGRRCIKAPVIYINLELQPWAIDERLALLCHARPECKFTPKTLAIWKPVPSVRQRCSISFALVKSSHRVAPTMRKSICSRHKSNQPSRPPSHRLAPVM